MSSVASSVAANPTGGCSSQSYSQLPTQDVACAVARATTDGLPSNYTDLMKGCCKSAPVESFASNCGLYCLSVGQSVADLTKCFQDAGINPSYVFCNSNNTATATGTPSGTGASATGGKATGSAASSGSAASATSTKGAASVTTPHHGVSKAALVTVGLLFFSAAAGALL